MHIFLLKSTLLHASCSELSAMYHISNIVYSVEKRITQICAYNLVAQLKSLTKLVNRPGLEEHYIYLSKI